MDAKACRKRTKRELKATKGSDAPRDRLRERWIVARCWNCMLCPSLLAKLQAKGRGASWVWAAIMPLLLGG